MDETGKPADPVTDAVAQAVAAAGRRGVALDNIWAIAHDADPELAWAPGRRARLRALLDGLAASGAVTWSQAGTAFDRAGSPPLPLRVRTTEVTPPARRERATVPTVWRPELDTVTRLVAPRPDELAALHRINDWLRDHAADAEPAPQRERSWEIFGDEKRLDRLLKSRMFRDGVVSLALLKAFVVHPPFVHRRLGDTGDIMICENHQTYHSAWTVLSEGDHRGFAAVGYGAGNLFPTSVSYVEDLAVGGDVVYFGDLDAAGLRIAVAAAKAAEETGVCRVVPASRLYEQLLKSPVAAAAAPISETEATSLAAWLDPSQQATAVGLLVAGRRIPQEAVSAPALRCMSTWR